MTDKFLTNKRLTSLTMVADGRVSYAQPQLVWQVDDQQVGGWQARSFRELYWHGYLATEGEVVRLTKKALDAIAPPGTPG